MILIVINELLALDAGVAILFENLDLTKTISYIMVLVVGPLFSLFGRSMFGQEYRTTKLLNRKYMSNLSVTKS